MEKMLSMYWFLVLFLVAAGISAMVFAFYSHPYDVRDVESRLLGGVVTRCIVSNGVLNNELVVDGIISQEFKDSFLEKCNITLGVEHEQGFEKRDQYYFEINFHNLNDNPLFDVTAGGFVGSDISAGDPLWKQQCLTEDEKFEKFPGCNLESFYAIDSANNQYVVSILSIVRKSEKNVR